MRPSIANLSVVAVWIAIALVVAAPYWYWSGGLLELEATQFIQQYLDSRGLLQKVFDPRTNDLGTYQAREFSYLIDYLDAKFFAATLAADRPLFIPASAIVACLLTVIVYVKSVPPFGLPAVTTALLLLVYVSNYVHVVSMGMFYRSAKPLLTPLVMAASFVVLSALREATQSSARSRAVMIAVLFSLMSLLDRQGFFYAVVGLGVLLLRDLVMRRRPGIETVAAGVAVAAMVVYNVVLAPLIVLRVNGYRPTLEFQDLPVAQLLDLGLVTRSTQVLLKGLSVLFAGLPGRVIAVALIAVVAYGIYRFKAPAVIAGTPGGSAVWTRARVAVLVLAVGVSQIVMFTVMVYRHPPLYERADHAIWYYPLPLQAFLTTLAVPLLAVLVNGWSKTRRAIVNAVLVTLVIANVVQWRNYEREQRAAHWFGFVYSQSWLLKRSIEDARSYQLRPGYQEFFEFCLRRSARLRQRAGSFP